VRAAVVAAEDLDQPMLGQQGVLQPLFPVDADRLLEVEDVLAVVQRADAVPVGQRVAVQRPGLGVQQVGDDREQCVAPTAPRSGPARDTKLGSDSSGNAESWSDVEVATT